MADPTQLLTKLDAVNLCLSSIGQTPINSLDVVGNRDANIASLALDNTTREVLLHGWSFNTDEEYELVPNQDGQIIVPSGVLYIDPSRIDRNYVVRWDNGSPKIYDKTNRTFTIEENPLRVDIIWAFAFEEVPQHARHYIATRAARIFQSQVLGSDVLFRFTEQHEMEALALMRRIESRQKDRNWFDKPNSTNDIFFRQRNPRVFGG